MKKYGVILNITNNFLAFWFDYFIYIRAIFSTTLSQSRLFIKIAIIRIKKHITL